MTAVNVGDSFPEGVSFGFIPISPETSDFNSCGRPQQYNASEEFKNKKVILVSVPGAFTPTCQVSHLPSYINNVEKLKAQGVDQVVVIAYNDPFVMSAWAKANGIKNSDFFVFASDAGTKFSQSIDWTAGERTARYAIAVDHGKVIYASKEEGGGIEASGAEAVIAKL